jgi:hypothetical protein
MVIDVSWNYGGRVRSTKLTSIIGERTVTPTQLQAEGNVRFVVQASTSFEAAGQASTLEATAGMSQSKIENKQVAVADHSGRAGRLLITQGDSDLRTDVSGATATVHAPPNPSSAIVNALAQPASLAGSPLQGFLGGTRVEVPTVQVVNELPAATGRFQFDGGSGAEAFWIHTDVGPKGATELRLDPTAHVLELNRAAAAKISGESRAEATALGSGRKVESYAQAAFGRLDLLPASLGATRPVVYVENFDARLTCTATAQASSSPVTGTWTATLSYWTDADPGDGAANGDYQQVSLNGSTTSTASDPLASIKTTNPLVYDDPDPAKDIYLFKTSSVNGYLSDWYSRPKIESGVDADGRIRTASLDGAIYISTAPVNPDVAASGVGVSIGSLSCNSEDARGL